MVEQIKSERAKMQLQQKDASEEKDRALEREIAGVDANVTMQKIHADTDRDTIYVNAQTARDQTNAQLKIQELDRRERIALLEFANREKISINDAKVQLAKATMAEQTKRQLAQAQVDLNLRENYEDRMLDLHKHHTSLKNVPAPLEPAGRAEPGQAFSQ
jgi:lipopolysaccharide export LptBFGC system permease protein LptF